MWNMVKKTIKTLGWLFIIAIFALILLAVYFNDTLKQYNESLTLAIMIVYVAATIVISEANNESARATREQVIESKRQFEDSKRLSILPELWVEAENADSVMAVPDISLELSNPEKCNGFTYYTLFVLVLHNIGFGSAKEITYSWQNIDAKNKRGNFPQRVIFSKEGCETLVEVCVAPDDIDDMIPTQSRALYLTYKDLLNNTYTQKVELFFNIYDEKTYHEGDALHIRKCVTYPAKLVSKGIDGDAN